MRLHLNNTKDPNQSYQIDRFPCIVSGEKKGAGLVLDCEGVSTPHAVFIRREEEIRLVDLESQDGTAYTQPGEMEPHPCPSTDIKDPDRIPNDILEEAPLIQNGTMILVGAPTFRCSIEASPAFCPPELDLIVVRGTEKGRRVRLLKPTVILGSGPSADVVFSYESLADQHARISIEDSGEMYIEDMDSVSGTYINGKRIHERQRLQCGKTVSLGRAVNIQVQNPRLSARPNLLWALVGIVLVIGFLTLIAVRRDSAIPEPPPPPEEPESPPISSPEKDPENTEVSPSVKDSVEGASVLPWDREKLKQAQQDLLASPSTDGERILDEIQRRMVSLHSQDAAYASIRAGVFRKGLEQLEDALEIADDNAQAAEDIQRLRRLQNVLEQIRSEFGYDTLDEDKIAELVARANAEVMHSPIADAIHGFIHAGTRHREAFYQARAEQAVRSGRPIEALEALRAWSRLSPWNPDIRNRLDAIRDQAEPELETMLINAYQLESRQSAAYRRRAAQEYQQIMALCSSNDWTAKILFKARKRAAD